MPRSARCTASSERTSACVDRSSQTIERINSSRSGVAAEPFTQASAFAQTGAEDGCVDVEVHGAAILEQQREGICRQRAGRSACYSPTRASRGQRELLHCATGINRASAVAIGDLDLAHVTAGEAKSWLLSSRFMTFLLSLRAQIRTGLAANRVGWRSDAIGRERREGHAWIRQPRSLKHRSRSRVLAYEAIALCARDCARAGGAFEADCARRRARGPARPSRCRQEPRPTAHARSFGHRHDAGRVPSEWNAVMRLAMDWVPRVTTCRGRPERRVVARRAPLDVRRWGGLGCPLTMTFAGARVRDGKDSPRVGRACAHASSADVFAAHEKSAV